MTEAFAAAPRRRWLRVSLRGLMLLVLVVGGLVGWMAHAIRTQGAGVAAVESTRGYVKYDWQFRRDAQGELHEISAVEPSAPAWLRRWLGDELFQSVVVVALADLKSTATLAAVARLDQVETLTITDEAGDDVRYDDLRRLTHLRSLGLTGRGLTADKLAVVGQIQSLDGLFIDRTELTDPAIAPLAELPNLTELAFSQSRKLTDAGLARVLAGVPRLRKLSLPFFKSSTATTQQLARSHRDLETLDLGYSEVTDADFAAIGQLRQLQVLEASSEQVTDVGLAHLARLTRLRKLDLKGAAITDIGLVHLAGLTTLEELDLSKTRITDAGLMWLDRLTALTFLSLNDNPGITDAGMVPAHFGPLLRHLGVYETKITRAGVQPLRVARPDLYIIAKPGNIQDLTTEQNRP